MKLFTKKKEVRVYAPVDGQAEPLSDVSDQVFSSGMMGKGYAVKPTNKKVYSPIKGKVTQVFATKHAIGLTTKNGEEILLHMGIDTVELNGAPFTILVKEGDSVDRDTEVAEMDLDQIAAAQKDNTVMVVVTNTSEKIKDLNLVTNGVVNAGDQVGTMVEK